MLRPTSSYGPHAKANVLQIERLEPRMLLAGIPIVSEFMARNDAGLRDGDDRSSDWIEVYNAGDEPIDLIGYRLTNEASDLSKWTFPSVNLDSAKFLVVFASGQSTGDYVDKDGNLHTNFTLERAGGYLALVAPDNSVVSEYGTGGAEYPEQLPNVSYGIAQSISFIHNKSDVDYLVPMDARAEHTWFETDFDASANGFSKGRPSFGLETSRSTRNSFNGQFDTELPEGTHGVYTRLSFQLENAAALNGLVLRLKYDNGFVAYLNGVRIVEENAPANLGWLSTAIDQSRSDRIAMEFVDFDLSQYVDSLQDGNNVLAIHGLNHPNDVGDMLLVAELSGTSVDLDSAIGLPPMAGYLATATPGGHNVAPAEVFGDFVRAIQFGVEHGFFDSPQQVEISTETSDVEILYTTDGSLPSFTNPVAKRYEGPITVGATTTLRAAAFRGGFLPSTTITQTYLFLDDVIVQSPDGEAPMDWPSRRVNTQVFDYGMDPEIVNDPEYGALIKDALLDISTISIVTDHDHLFDARTGVFVNGITARGRNDEWERPTSVELIHPDGSEGFQIDAGVRLRGGYSRLGDNPKHAFRLMFRAEYGEPKLIYPFFGDEGVNTFDNIDLRTAQVPSWSFCTADVANTSGGCQFNTMVREVFSRDTQAAMGQPYTRSRYHHLYLNGQYWGLFQSQERAESSYAQSYFGGEKSDFDVIKVESFPHRIQATDGNLDAWRQLWNEAKQGFATDEAYFRVQGLNLDGTRNVEYPVLLDVENLVDYMITIFYTGDLDSPISNFGGNDITNNWFGIRSRTGEEGFQFFVHDAEWTLFSVRQNRLGPFPAGDTFGESNPQWLHQQLMENDEYRLYFADRAHKHLFNGGVLTPEAASSRFQRRVNEIDLAIIAESARWGDANRRRPYTKEDWLEAVSHITDTYIPQRTEILVDQFNRRARLRDRTPAPLYPNVAAPDFNQFGGVIVPGFELTMAATADVFYTLDGSDPRKSSEPSRQQYFGPIALDEATVVKARARVDNEWSAMVEASFRLPPPPVRISEIMYHPSDPTEKEQAAGFTDDDDFEFIELVNISETDTIPLQGVALTEGLQFTFRENSLAPGQRIVAVRDRAAFRHRYGEGIPIGGEYGISADGSKLSNRGEKLRLEDAVGTLIQEFVFSDQWYPSTDGSGFSLELVDSAVGDLDTWNRADSWLPSITAGGSPGNVNGILRQPGDANLDGVFNQLDLVLVLQAAKYLTNQSATFAEGDWNNDGLFNELDIVVALQAGNYTANG